MQLSRSGSAPVSPVLRTPRSSPVPQPAHAPHSALLSFDVTSLACPGGKPLRDHKAALFHQTARDRELLASLQQAIVTAVGPAACLSTSGVLYMRVSYHEAGALIGTRGCRIRQIMETTGAKIHVGKTRISEPFALTKISRDQRNKFSSKLKSDSILPCDVGGEAVDSSTNQPLQDTENNNPDSIDHTKAVEVDSIAVTKVDRPTTDIETCEVSSDEAAQTIPTEHIETKIKTTNPETLDRSDAGKATERAPSSASHSPVRSRAEVVQDEEASPTDLSTMASKSSAQSGYRLVTLSGPLQAQLMAHWRIFQCLKSLRPREEKHDKVSADKSTVTNSDDSSRLKNAKSDTPNSQFHAAETLRLATLICIPYAFWSWLTVPNTTFEHPDLPDEDRQRTNASALSWLQAEARRRMRDRFPDYAQIKAICPLRRPKNRIMARICRGPVVTGTHAPTTPTTAAVGNLASPMDDIVTALWSDRSRAPIEIYADYETTQFLLGCLHHMHAIWLYGETVVQRTTAMSNQSALLSTPPSRRQQPLVYSGARSGVPSHLGPGLRQTIPAANDLNGLIAATSAAGRGTLFDWSPLWWPWLPVDPYGRVLGNPNGAVQLTHPAAFGQFPLIQSTAAPGTTASGPGLIPNVSKTGQTNTGGPSSALLFNPFPLTPSLVDLPGKPFTGGLRWDDFSRTDRTPSRKQGGPPRPHPPVSRTREPHPEPSAPPQTEESSTFSKTDSPTDVSSHLRYFHSNWSTNSISVASHCFPSKDRSCPG
ncbi:unnamed protein product [Echinostoma caproni]|uniref:KH domain-containing protein n=1 Tax=Echinostoma caproni TaxID=27848 RepID=A0A183AWH2_9TREM|nr:unnamed protein product [Echinostoma caproni]